ncbi:MAG: M28 family peptidase [Chloroflexota bacterium]
MSLKEILQRVDTERLYQHVLRLEGVRHPIDTPEKLKEAADYIYAEMESYGLPVRAQAFRLADWDDTFYNIEGWLGDKDEPAAVIINHYDTVYNTPGANDNAAGVAVMLEAARVLAGEENLPAVRFVSASLEEGLPPAVKLRLRRRAQELGLTDASQRYTSYAVARLVKQHTELVGAAINAGKFNYEALGQATEQLKDKMPRPLLTYLHECQQDYAGLDAATAIGKTGKIGSSAWVDEALHLGKKIRLAICLDEIGTTFKHKRSQRLPENLTYDMLQTYQVDAEGEVGDWAFIIADASSSRLAQAFCAHCQREDIDLGHAFFQMPGFEVIAGLYPQAFGSDHAPFWRAGIPAVFAFDTSNWRNPFVHSMGDTIDRLDFDHITKLCKATIATAIDPNL